MEQTQQTCSNTTTRDNEVEIAQSNWNMMLSKKIKEEMKWNVEKKVRKIEFIALGDWGQITQAILEHLRRSQRKLKNPNIEYLKPDRCDRAHSLSMHLVHHFDANGALWFGTSLLVHRRRLAFHYKKSRYAKASVPCSCKTTLNVAHIR